MIKLAAVPITFFLLQDGCPTVHGVDTLCDIVCYSRQGHDYFNRSGVIVGIDSNRVIVVKDTSGNWIADLSGGICVITPHKQAAEQPETKHG